MIKDFFAHPMRIFFLASSFCAVLGGAVFFTPTDFISAHKFIFLHLFAALAYAGFLLTGLTDWTNFDKSLNIHSYTLFSLFAVSFSVMFFNLWSAHLFIAFFWAYLIVLCAYMVWLDKNSDQLGVLAFLVGILAFEICFLLSGDEKFLNLQIHIHIIAVLLVSFRVSMVLGREALKREANMDEAVFVPNFVYKNIAITCVCAFLIVNLLIPRSDAIGYVAIACGSAILAKLKEWHFKELLRHNFVIFYYLMQLFTSIAYIIYGFSLILGLGFETATLHVIAINGMVFTIMLIFNIAGLRHSGQELEFLRLSKIAFILVIVAGISRGAFGYFWSGFYIHLPATLIAVAFTLWIIDFYKIFRDNEFSDDPE